MRNAECGGLKDAAAVVGESRVFALVELCRTDDCELE